MNDTFDPKAAKRRFGEPPIDEKAARQRIDELNAKMLPLEQEVAWLRQQLLESRSVFRVGDVITWNNGSRTGRVIGIVGWHFSTPEWSVISIRKDGSEGGRLKVRQWQKPVLVLSSTTV